MHAAVVDVLGQPPRYQSFPDPTPAEGEEVVRVAAAGLHPIVKALASGAHYAGTGELPMVPGVDGIGMRRDGSRVYFVFPRKPWGSMGEVAPVASSRCLPLPENLDTVLAAAIANPGMSAWLPLRRRADLKPGETVLILGATGVAGHVAIQLARHLGAARVIGAGRNVDALRDAKLDGVIALGSSEEELRNSFAEYAGQGIDVVLDYLWGQPAELLLEALAKNYRPESERSTRFVQVGDSAGKTLSLRGSILRSVDLHLLGSGFGAASFDHVVQAVSDVFQLASQGVVQLPVEAVPLAEVEKTWSGSETNRRVVFTI